MQGSRYTVVPNGTTILDADLAAVPSNLDQHVGKDNRDGHFACCCHGDTVEFRGVTRLAPRPRRRRAIVSCR